LIIYIWPVPSIRDSVSTSGFSTVPFILMINETIIFDIANKAETIFHLHFKNVELRDQSFSALVSFSLRSLKGNSRETASSNAEPAE